MGCVRGGIHVHIILRSGIISFIQTIVRKIIHVDMDGAP
jgi:hypothetical protein